MGNLSQEKSLSFEEYDFHRKKMLYVGPIVSKIAHDVNNYLTVITGFSELISLRLTDEKTADYLAEMQKAADQIATLTRRFQVYSRRNTAKLAAMQLQPWLSDFFGTKLAVPEFLQVTFECATDLWPVQTDRYLLEQVLRQIATNSLEAMKEGGILKVKAYNLEAPSLSESSLSTTDAGTRVAIDLDDEGDGIPPEIIEHLFEPFTTTKENHSGFGLFTAYALTQKIKADLLLQNLQPRGTRVQILLPKAPPADSRT